MSEQAQLPIDHINPLPRDSMKKALICGVSGQDGAYLAKLLLSKGYKVFGSSRDAEQSGFRNLVRLGVREQVQTLSIAPNDFRSVLHAITRLEPDEIYNLSGQSSVGLSFDQPVDTFESITNATFNFLEALRYLRSSARFYNASSSECFGETAGEAADEQTPFRPRSPYAVAKAAAFWNVSNYREAYGLFACSGILFNHESPLRPERFVTQKIAAAVRRIRDGSNERLRLGNLAIKRDWGWAPEYVDAMWRMLQAAAPDDYVIGTGESNSLEEFVDAAFSAADLDWRRFVDFDNGLIRPTEILCSRSDPTNARSGLGWTASYNMSRIAELLVSGNRAP